MKNSPFPRVTDNIVELLPGGPPADAGPSTELIRIEPPEEDDEELCLPSDPANDPAPDTTFAPVTQAEASTLALSPPQRKAIELLTSGRSLVDSATAAGVSRMTLHRWLKGDAAFSAAFNAWQKDVLDTARGRLLAMSDLAVTTVAKSMARGDAKTALKILQSIGVLECAQPGSTDPKEIERLRRLEDQKSKTALKKAEARAEMESYEPL